MWKKVLAASRLTAPKAGALGDILREHEEEVAAEEQAAAAAAAHKASFAGAVTPDGGQRLVTNILAGLSKPSVLGADSDSPRRTQVRGLVSGGSFRMVPAVDAGGHVLEAQASPLLTTAAGGFGSFAARKKGRMAQAQPTSLEIPASPGAVRLSAALGRGGTAAPGDGQQPAADEAGTPPGSPVRVTRALQKGGMPMNFGVLRFATKLVNKTKEKRYAQVRRKVAAALARGDVISEVRFTGDDEAKDTKQQQGDIAHYSEEALRKRDQLRRNPVVQEAVAKWWDDLPKVPGSKPPGIDRKAYIIVFVPLYFRLVPGADADEARDAVHQDWKTESAGKPTMDENAFFKSLFSLADMWCDTTDASEYVDFIQELHRIVFDPQSDTALTLARHRDRLNNLKEKRVSRGFFSRKPSVAAAAEGSKQAGESGSTLESPPVPNRKRSVGGFFASRSAARSARSSSVRAEAAAAGSGWLRQKQMQAQKQGQAPRIQGAAVAAQVVQFFAGMDGVMSVGVARSAAGPPAAPAASPTPIPLTAPTPELAPAADTPSRFLQAFADRLQRRREHPRPPAPRPGSRQGPFGCAAWADALIPQTRPATAAAASGQLNESTESANRPPLLLPGAQRARRRVPRSAGGKERLPRPGSALRRKLHLAARHSDKRRIAAQEVGAVRSSPRSPHKTFIGSDAVRSAEHAPPPAIAAPTVTAPPGAIAVPAPAPEDGSPPSPEAAPPPQQDGGTPAWAEPAGQLVPAEEGPSTVERLVRRAKTQSRPPPRLAPQLPQGVRWAQAAREDGLGAQEWCARHGVAPTAFAAWLEQELRRTAAAAEGQQHPADGQQPIAAPGPDSEARAACEQAVAAYLWHHDARKRLGEEAAPETHTGSDLALVPRRAPDSAWQNPLLAATGVPDLRQRWRAKATREGITGRDFCAIFDIDVDSFRQWYANPRTDAGGSGVEQRVRQYVLHEPDLADKWKRRAIEQGMSGAEFASRCCLNAGEFFAWLSQGWCRSRTVFRAVWRFVLDGEVGPPPTDETFLRAPRRRRKRKKHGAVSPVAAEGNSSPGSPPGSPTRLSPSQRQQNRDRERARIDAAKPRSTYRLERAIGCLPEGSGSVESLALLLASTEALAKHRDGICQVLGSSHPVVQAVRDHSQGLQLAGPWPWPGPAASQLPDYAGGARPPSPNAKLIGWPGALPELPPRPHTR